MSKTISSILMTVIILANFFAPISVGWGDKKIEVRENIIRAEVPIAGDYNFQIKLNISSITDVSAEINADITADSEVFKSYIGGASYLFLKLKILGKDKNGDDIKDINVPLSEIKNGKENKKLSLNHLNFLTNYTITATITEETANSTEYNYSGSSKVLYTSEPKTFTTNENGVTEPKDGGSIGEVEMINSDPMPECGLGKLTGGGTMGGCIAQVIYYLVFVPSSFLFALTGVFFDNTFAYSVNDNSYRSVFVVEGWNIVRDFCNMFFIFVLLYIAFGTILNLHNVKTKEMIINVVIIGLLINFSLFATRVIIDASNILARVFYNSNTIKITAVEKGGDTSNLIEKANETGVLPLSAALVNKVDPQSLIINAKAVGDIPDKAGKVDPNGITATNFIVITLIASVVNIIGCIVFLSVGLIFVARVIGLWLAMIIVPFAFFSYTVPSMQDMEMVGWKKWWPETLKLAFLAPVFIFFLYLILQFLEKGFIWLMPLVNLA